QELHRLASWITANSHHQRETMERHFPWMRKKISTIYNGVDLEKFKPGEEPRMTWASDPPRLLVVANTAYKKNDLGLAKALTQLRETDAVVPTVTWVGPSPTEEDRKAREVVDLYIRTHGLSPYWTWLGVRDDIPSLMSDYDALIHPAFYEGLPNAICEA